MVTLVEGRIEYSGTDAIGSTELCIKAAQSGRCNNPDRLWSPCPQAAHEYEDCSNFEQPRRPRWWYDPITDSQLSRLYALHADLEWSAFELGNITKGEASELIRTYVSDPILL